MAKSSTIKPRPRERISQRMSRHSEKPRKQTLLLAAVAVGMFGFAFALVPLYNMFCELTGINGRSPNQTRATIDGVVPSDREVTVQFLASVDRGMPWEFKPLDGKLRVRLGEMNQTRFSLRNRADRPVTGQTVPSISPGQAALYLRKVECFCFTQQQLEAGEEMEVLMTFFVDPELPDEINEMTLSYTVFLVPETQAASAPSDGRTDEG